MIGGSQQLRTYRRARAKGLPTEQAAALAGIQIGEAKLIDAEDARNPPPTDALLPISAPLDPDPALAGPASTTTKEPAMARRKKSDGDRVEEIKKPDFDLAVKIYREDIRPAQARVGEFAQEQSTAYKAIKKQAHIQPAAAKLAFGLDQMEESKRDDFLRCLNGLLTSLKISMPKDMVDVAEGNTAAGGSVIPMADRKAPKLATIPSDDSDLSDGDEQHEAAE